MRTNRLKFLRRYRKKLISRDFIFQCFMACDHKVFTIKKPDLTVKLEGDYELGEIYQMEGSPNVRYGCYEQDGETFIFLKLNEYINSPIYGYGEPVTINKGDIDNYTDDKPYDTCYGAYLANQILFADLFGDKFDYHSVITGKFLNDMLAESRLDGTIETDDIYKVGDRSTFIGGLAEICVPTFSQKSLVTHPDLPKLKADLLEKYKDDLTPANVVKIEDALIAKDREWLEGDVADDYFQCNGKGYNVTRKKMYGMVGLSETLTDKGIEYSLIDKSLSEGWMIEDMASMATDIRKGSYSRAKETAKGGEDTKNVIRIFQAINITEDDCKTKKGRKCILTKDTIKGYIGRHVFVGSKEYVITKDNMDQFLDIELQVRGPGHCLTEGNNCCYACCGEILRKIGIVNIGLQVIYITSRFMMFSMKAMHGTKSSVFDASQIHLFLK